MRPRCIHNHKHMSTLSLCYYKSKLLMEKKTCMFLPFKTLRLSAEAACFSVCSACSRRLVSNSRASCNFLFAFFSFFSLFWTMARKRELKINFQTISNAADLQTVDNPYYTDFSLIKRVCL